MILSRERERERERCRYRGGFHFIAPAPPSLRWSHGSSGPSNDPPPPGRGKEGVVPTQTSPLLWLRWFRVSLRTLLGPPTICATWCPNGRSSTARTTRRRSSARAASEIRNVSQIPGVIWGVAPSVFCQLPPPCGLGGRDLGFGGRFVF